MFHYYSREVSWVYWEGSTIYTSGRAGTLGCYDFTGWWYFFVLQNQGTFYHIWATCWLFMEVFFSFVIASYPPSIFILTFISDLYVDLLPYLYTLLYLWPVYICWHVTLSIYTPLSLICIYMLTCYPIIFHEKNLISRLNC